MNSIYNQPRRHAITVEEFMRMGKAHVFAHHARLELMEGEIVEMAPVGSAHAAVVCTLDTLLREVAPRAMVRVQSPLVLGERSVPQPDAMLLRPRVDRYFHSHPVAADALLVVEAADTTLEYDVFREPGSGYSIHHVLRVGDSATVAALASVAFTVSALFPDL